jgi:hypothetical protein
MVQTNGELGQHVSGALKKDNVIEREVVSGLKEEVVQQQG